MPAERQLAALKSVVTLSPAQEQQAWRIFQKLKETMDAMGPEDRGSKGAQSRQEARAAIRALLTPEQQKIYDNTPQGRGGGSTQGTPERVAFNKKVRAFVISSAKTSSEISARVGTVQQVEIDPERNETNIESINDGPARTVGGFNVVHVFGAASTGVFKISWIVNQSGDLEVAKVAVLPN